MAERSVIPKGQDHGNIGHRPQRQSASGGPQAWPIRATRFAPNARELRVVGPDPEPLVPGREDAELGIGVIGVVLGVLGEPREDLAAQSARIVDDNRRDRQTFEQ